MPPGLIFDAQKKLLEKAVSRSSGSALLSINDICSYKINSAGMKAHFHVTFIQITFPQRPTSCNLIVFLQTGNL